MAILSIILGGLFLGGSPDVVRAAAPTAAAFSPAGDVVVISASDDRRQYTYRILNPDCLRQAAPLSCQAVFSAMRAKPSFSWSPDGTAVIVLAGARWAQLNKKNGGWALVSEGATPPTIPTLPEVLESAFFSDAASRMAQASPPSNDPAIFLGFDGQPAVQQVFASERHVVLDRLERRWDLDQHLFDWRFSRLDLPLSIRVVGNRGDFEMWSQNAGRTGRLWRISNAGVRTVDPPGKGPWRTVAGPGEWSQGFYSLDRLVAPGALVAQDVNAFVKEARRADASLEIRDIAASAGFAAAVVTLESPNRNWMLAYCRHGEACRMIDSAAGAIPATIKSSSPLHLAGRLPARLYKTRTSKPKGVVIYFQGGPGANVTLNNHGPTRLLTRLGYDVLTVDYQGSSGYGKSHYLAADRRVGEALLEDLMVSTRWARTRYRGQVVGFYGVSLGGQAGIRAWAARAPGLDFMVLDSPAVRVERCDGPDGIRILGSGKEPCSFGSFGQPSSTPARPPTFVLLGGRDRNTPPKWAAAWIAGERSAGDCIVEHNAADGGHGLEYWPERSRQDAEARLAAWLSAIEAGKPCASAP